MSRNVQRVGAASATEAPPDNRPPLRLVCAVSRSEKRLFLDHAQAALEALPVALSWVETQATGEHLQRLPVLRPEILLTGWSTGELPRDWLEAGDCTLRYVCHLAGSVRRLVSRGFIERGGIVTNWNDLPSGAVAEHAVLLAVAALRGINAWPAMFKPDEELTQRIERLNTRTLFGKRVGLHGFGRVARALVRLLEPYGVTIQAYSRGVSDTIMRGAGVRAAESLRALFAGNDVIFECEGLTPVTRGSVSADILAALPNDAVLVNIGRGELIDEPALLREATSGRIRVALDVGSSPGSKPIAAFAGLPNAIVSPHVAGPTLDQYSLCGDFALRNLASFLQKQSLEGIVTLADYDRST